MLGEQGAHGADVLAAPSLLVRLDPAHHLVVIHPNMMAGWLPARPEGSAAELGQGGGEASEVLGVGEVGQGDEDRTHPELGEPR